MASFSQPWSDPEQPGGLTALTYAAGDAIVIAVSGKLDLASAVALDGPLTVALDGGRCHLVLDLHLLRSLNTESLSVLWSALRHARRCGGSLAVVGVATSLRAALEPLVPHGLRLHGSVRSAVSASRGADARTRVSSAPESRAPVDPRSGTPCGPPATPPPAGRGHLRDASRPLRGLAPG